MTRILTMTVSVRPSVMCHVVALWVNDCTQHLTFSSPGRPYHSSCLSPKSITKLWQRRIIIHLLLSYLCECYINSNIKLNSVISILNICRASYTWKQQSSTGLECIYFMRIKLSMTSYKRTVQSHEDTRRNCAEFGANLTADIPSSGALNSFVSLIAFYCLFQKYTTKHHTPVQLEATWHSI